jgi:uncharacterized protein YceK
MNKNLLLVLTVALFVSGCAKIGAKLTGDDQLVKGEIKEADIEMAGIKEAMADLKASMSAQFGMINKTQTDNRETQSGRDSVMNDPDMINKFIIVFAITIGVPYLSMLLIFYFYMRYNEKTQKRFIENKENKT